MKISLGDKSSELACINAFAGITSYVGRRILRGRQGLESILNISQMKYDSCLSSCESDKRISIFIRNTKVLLELALQSFITEYDLKILPSYLFTYDIMQMWYQTLLEVLPDRIEMEQKDTKTLSQMAERLLDYPTSSFLSDPLTELPGSHLDKDEPLLNMESSRRDNPETKFVHFVKFVTKMHPRIAMKAQVNSTKHEVTTEETLNRELKGIRKTQRQGVRTKYQVKGSNMSSIPEKSTVNVATKAQKPALGIQGRTFAILCPFPALN